MKRVLRIADWLSITLVVWAVLRLIPLEAFWFDPGQIIVGNGSVSHVPVIQYNGEIKRNVLIRYQVVIRNLDSGRIVCDPRSDAFTYRPGTKRPEPILLHEYWTGGNPRCWPLDTGSYIMETCWTAPNLFWGLTGEKTTCRMSNTFLVESPPE